MTKRQAIAQKNIKTKQIFCKQAAKVFWILKSPNLVLKLPKMILNHLLTKVPLHWLKGTKSLGKFVKMPNQYKYNLKPIKTFPFQRSILTKPFKSRMIKMEKILVKYWTLNKKANTCIFYKLKGQNCYNLSNLKNHSFRGNKICINLECEPQNSCLVAKIRERIFLREHPIMAKYSDKIMTIIMASKK